MLARHNRKVIGDQDSAFRLATHVNLMCIRPQKMALENKSIREVHPEKELTGGGGVLSAEWLSKGSECPLLCETWSSCFWNNQRYCGGGDTKGERAVPHCVPIHS